MSFNSLAGNGGIINTIRNLTAAGKFPQSVIFYGDEGSGRFTAAMECAAALVCSDSGYVKLHGEGCGVCLSCGKAAENIHPDVIVCGSAESTEKSFHIEDIREVTDDLYMLPSEAERKVIVMRNAQDMTVQAQNALLKSLEEPPRFVNFILTATDPELLLDTIRSRCAVFKMQPVPEEIMKSYLTEHYPQIGSEKIAHACLMSGGAVGIALKHLDDTSDTYGKICLLYLEALVNGDFFGVFREMTAFQSRSELSHFYSLLECAVRDVALYKAQRDNKAFPAMFFSDLKDAEHYADLISSGKLTSVCSHISKCRAELSLNANIRLNMTLFLNNNSL